MSKKLNTPHIYLKFYEDVPKITTNVSYEKIIDISKIPISIRIVLKFNRNKSEHAKNREKKRFSTKKSAISGQFCRNFGN